MGLELLTVLRLSENFGCLRAAEAVWSPHTYGRCVSCSPVTTFLPLIIVLGISMVKEAIEDFGRYRADKSLNKRLVSAYNPVSQSFEQKQWQQVQVSSQAMQDSPMHARDRV